jgi:hypothetical protein
MHKLIMDILLNTLSSATPLQWLATLFFALSILHTFLVKTFLHLSKQYKDGSIGENFFHLLGEVEIVFGLWAGLLLASIALIESPDSSLHYLESRNFTEPAFVFVILVICATKPVLDLAEGLVTGLSRLLPFRRSIAFYTAALTVGPILGSFITEPAAMTVTAFLLLKWFFKKNVSTHFKYATLGVLFVNVSIGGTLTPFAAPPVLMVAGKWGWGIREMFFGFGWKGALACLISTVIVTIRFRKELLNVRIDKAIDQSLAPVWLRICHLLFLVGIVAAAHHAVLVIGIFLIFLGFVQVTGEHQDQLRLKEGLLVSFFLAGLVVIGGMQGWWLEPILGKLTELPLYLGAIGLTAFTDNAALTYLGTLVPSLTEPSRYALVAGAVVGGGLTVIANAPNPAGYNILQESFGEEGISPRLLFTHALIPTGIAALCFWFL